MADADRAERFPTTCWRRVAAARDHGTPEARLAIVELCSTYWFPLYAFFRRKGSDPELALDLTQDYFARLLERGIVEAANPDRGRFRSFLLADATRFLADRRRHERAAKRGGGRALLSIDARDAEGRYLREPAHGRTPERIFERNWALAVLDAVLTRLRREYETTGRGPLFDALKGFLTAGEETAPRAELADRPGTTAGALDVAVHRLRRRYRDLIREVIAETVADPGDVEDELRGLFAALGSES